jgi:hypothetical protein
MSNELRAAIYALAAAVLGVLAVQGYVDQEMQDAILQTVLAAVNLMASFLTWKQRKPVE